MTVCWLELLERFQTAIAAFVGFTGIILTIFANAYLARKERQAIRSQDRQALIAAIRGELEVLRKTLDTSLQNLTTEQNDHGDLVYPYLQKRPHPIFDEFLPKVGMLSGDTVTKLVRGYAAWAQLPSRLRLNMGSDGIISDDYILVESEQLKVLKPIVQQTRDAIVNAVEALNQEAKAG